MFERDQSVGRSAMKLYGGIDLHSNNLVLSIIDIKDAKFLGFQEKQSNLLLK